MNNLHLKLQQIEKLCLFELELKTEIVETIASKTGWDILFFAGHSNETSLTGGEFSIAPNVTLSLSEIVPSLTVAKERGLQ